MYFKWNKKFPYPITSTMTIYQQQFVFRYCITVAFYTTGVLVLTWTVFALGTNLATETLSVSTTLCTRRTSQEIYYLIGEKKPSEKWQIFCGDQYFSPTYNYTRLKLTPTRIFYQLFFLLKKNQIMEILKELSYLLCHILVEWRWVGKGS